MKWPELIADIRSLLSDVRKIKGQMTNTVSREDLKTALQAEPQAIATAVIAGLKPLFDALEQRLTVSPEDFSTELTLIKAAPEAVTQAITAAFAVPVTPTGTLTTPVAPVEPTPLTGTAGTGTETTPTGTGS